MKTLIKRVCVWMLSLALIVSLLPMSAFAATVEAKMICGDNEHVHTDECYQTELVRPLTCGITGEGHTHGDECYAWSYGNELVCNHAAAEHTHTVEGGCFVDTELLTCGADEHTHSGACQKTCPLAEHQHGEECGEDCAIEEHTHDGSCQADCSLQEHTHADGCYTESRKLVCTLSDLPEEKHTEACYNRVKGQLLCTLEEIPAHEHTEACYGEAEEQKVLVCELEAHTHTKVCYTNEDKNTGKSLQVALKEALDAAANAQDKEVTLILNGQTLEYNASETDNAIMVSGGQTLNIEDMFNAGGIHGNTSGDDTIRLIVVSNGTVNLKGGILSGGKVTGSENGGAVLVGSKGQLNMSGGSITGNTANNGGGVAVNGGGQFTMTGGDISGNTANEGGGVFVNYSNTWGNGWKAGSFTMDGGVIDGNTALVGEGGGVYVKGEATITKGAITNNVTLTHKDLGGGGIYIEADGVVTLKNAIITGNTANGMGGGIAACVHGKTYVYALEGAVIAGNTALGLGHSEGYEKDGAYNGSFTDGYTYWASAKDVLKEMGQDIFAAGDSFHASFTESNVTTNNQGTAGIVVSNNLPNNSGTANWEGYTFCYVTDKDGKPVKDDNGNYVFELTEVTENNNGVVYGNRLVFLTANPDQESVQKAIEAMQNGVIISGNLSANSHGGGIANNGVLTIGEGPMSGMDSTPAEAGLNKTLVSNDENVTIADKTFQFQMTDAQGNEVGTVTNDGNGKATFNFPPEYFNDVKFEDGETEKVFEFYVTEVDDGQENVTYDGTQYKVVVKITRTVETVTIGNGTMDLETLSIGEPDILVAEVDEEGNVTGYVPAPNGIQFTNTYTKTEEPKPSETPTPSDKPGGDNPGSSVTPKDPDPETPIDEELDEPDVPLAELPVESEKVEELELEEPNVPLGDIPQTGDTPLGWYGAAILSALGLMIMTLLGRKKSQES